MTEPTYESRSARILRGVTEDLPPVWTPAGWADLPPWAPPTEAEWAELRRVAADWHGGQASALYALASSGAIGPRLWDEADVCLSDIEGGDDDPADVTALERIREVGQALTGPVVGYAPNPDDADRPVYPADRLTAEWGGGAVGVTRFYVTPWRVVAGDNPSVGWAVFSPDCFDPPVALVFADPTDHDDALDAWLEAGGLTPVEAPDLADYDPDSLYWTSGGAGPFDIEGVRQHRCSVWPRFD